MNGKDGRSLAIRALNCLCACTLLGALGYLVIVGIEAAAVTVLVAALAVVAVPVILNGQGVLDVLVGVAEALLDGVMAIIEGIISAVTSVFG